MKQELSLSTRAFLFAFIPMALTLVVSFVVINKAVEGQIKERLRTSMRENEAVLSEREAEHGRSSARVLDALVGNPSLSATVGLLREIRTPDTRSQALDTIALRIRTIAESLDYDLLLLADPQGVPVLGLIGGDRSRLDFDLDPVTRVSSSLLRVSGTLYEIVSAPVHLADENLGTLVLGRQFDIRAWSDFGHTTLIENDRILQTTFSPQRAEEALASMRLECREPGQDCEIEVGGQMYLALPIERRSLEDGTELISFQSVDVAASEVTRSVASVFPMIGGGGVLLVFLFSLAGSKSVARPLVDLMTHLRREQHRGVFPTDLPTNYRAEEVNQLAREFSRAAGAVRDSQRRLDHATEEFIESMTQAQDARDPHTAGHSERVSIHAVAIAKVMGLSQEEIEIIRIGARLHDLGKIGIPDAVLRKPGKLDAEEFRLIQRHPQIGKTILEKVGRFEPFLPIVELHHENPDGSGYPYGLVARDIPVGVRIVHVADVYDAITSDRAYRRAMSEAEAWDLLLRGMGSLFDPEAVEALATVLACRPTKSARGREPRMHANDGAFYSLPPVLPRT